MSSSLRGLALVAVIALGCGTRSLDPGEMSGMGGVSGVVMTGSGGAIADGGSGPPDGTIHIAVCGDGTVDIGEQCDDGNVRGGDGCSSLCQSECYWNCGTCGVATTCITPGACGDGYVGWDEACDDGNITGGDGCSADCKLIELGWVCPIPGRRCAPICGDGVVVGPETCDDGNTTAGDGCSDSCLTEPTTSRCGNGVLEGAEQCDVGTGTTDPTYGSGCSAQCRLSAYCGDGVVNGPEACDMGPLGNTAPFYGAFGCTPTCTFSHYCGDGIVDSNEGEQCDMGANNGAPTGYCTSTCKIVAI
jgi:cysteine-rich repeat protein